MVHITTISNAGSEELDTNQISAGSSTPYGLTGRTVVFCKGELHEPRKTKLNSC